MSDKKAMSARVMELRNILGVSVFEARRTVLKQDLLEAIDAARDLDDVKDILRTLAENWAMKP